MGKSQEISFTGGQVGQSKSARVLRLRPMFGKSS